MKNKYSSIVKIKKQALDASELELGKAKMNVAKKESLLVSKKEYYSSLSLQESGLMKAVLAGLKLREVARQDVIFAKEDASNAKREVSLKEALYKKAFLDYEKMKYLELEEIKKYKQKLKADEAKFLDEIAVSRYFKAKDE